MSDRGPVLSPGGGPPEREQRPAAMNPFTGSHGLGSCRRRRGRVSARFSHFEVWGLCSTGLSLRYCKCAWGCMGMVACELIDNSFRTPQTGSPRAHTPHQGHNSSGPTQITPTSSTSVLPAAMACAVKSSQVKSRGARNHLVLPHGMSTDASPLPPPPSLSPVPIVR